MLFCLVNSHIACYEAASILLLLLVFQNADNSINSVGLNCLCITVKTYFYRAEFENFSNCMCNTIQLSVTQIPELENLISIML